MKKNQAMIISYYRWWNCRQKYFSEWLGNRGYSVTFLTADYSHIHKDYIDGEEFPNYTKRIHVPSYKRNLSIKRIHSNYVFSRKVRKMLELEEPEVVICLIPSNCLGASVARWKKKHAEAIMIVDVLDCWPESIPSKLLKKVCAIPFGIWKNAREKTFKYANEIILECNLFKQQLRLNNCNKCDILYLNKDVIPIENSSKIDSTIVFGYIGSINHIIDVERITDLLCKINKQRDIHVKIIGKGDCQDYFVNSLRKAQINVTFYGAVFEQEKIQEIMKDCNFGINIMKNGLAVGLTTKSLDYFSLGLPIINSIPSDTYDLLERYNAGININAGEKNVIERFINMTEEEYDLMKKGATTLYKDYFFIDEFLKKLNYIMDKVVDNEQ